MIPDPHGTGPTGTNESDVRPVVAARGRATSVWLISGLAVLGGMFLFGVLESQRQARTQPATYARTADRVQMPSVLPPLIVPEPAEFSGSPPPPPPLPPRTSGRDYIVEAPATQAPPSRPESFTPPPQVYSPPLPTLPAQRSANLQGATARSEILVIDTTRSSTSPPAPSGLQSTGAGSSETTASDRASGSASRARGPVRATPLTRQAITVPQGTLIPAALETALDSTRSGQVRAIVSRDVAGFDGTRVMIPRGTRLIGDYEADLAAGQNRVVVQWTRLIRPDGMSISLDSPAADRLGRAGIQGRVNNHFLERFAAAVLQTTVNLGIGLANRSVDGSAPVIVALPGSTQTTTTPSTGSQIRPTLSVEAGTAVTVFVSRDLEFPAGAVQQ